MEAPITTTTINNYTTTAEQDCPLLTVTTTPLPLFALIRLREVIDASTLEQLLLFGFLAGGSVVYALHKDIPQAALGDLDVFIPDSHIASFIVCAHTLDDESPSPKRYYRQTATVKVHSRGKHPVQVILSAGSVADTIQSFDLDYVQCAISLSEEGVYLLHRTEMCSIAHEKRVVKYILDYPYNPMRLGSRLSKVYQKGFKLAAPYNTVGELGVRLHTPIAVRMRLSTKERNPELGIPIRSFGDVRGLSLEEQYDDPRQQPPARTTLHTSMADALEGELKTFSRKEYEGEPTTLANGERAYPLNMKIVPITKHTRCSEQDVWDIRESRPLTFIELGKSEREVKGVVRGNQCTDPLYQRYIALDERVNKGGEDSKRLFYLCRALKMVVDGEYDAAIGSAFSDANKLNQTHGGEISAFCLGMEMMMLVEDSKQGKMTKERALIEIERILGTEHTKETK